MDIEHLVTMANDIANFFHGASDPEHPPASNVATHLRRFWDPRMRKQIIAHYRSGGEGLNDIAREAVGILAGPAGTAAAQAGEELSG
jgi:formate dehydrogenase subunit delta